MADDNETSVIEIAPDAAAEPIVVTAEPDAAAKAEPADGVDQLRANLEAAKQARIEAETAKRAAEERAARFEREATDNRGQLVSGQVHQLNSAIEAVTHQANGLKRDYADALSAGDYSKVADLQFQIAEQAATLQQLKQGKTSLERQAKAPPQPQGRQAGRSGDPVADMAAGLSPRSAAWIRAHPEYARDDAGRDSVVAAHNAALEDGILPDSNRYFAFIEQQLGVTKPIEAEAVEVAATTAPAARRAPVAAAPVSRQAPAMNGSASTQKITLTKAQIEMGKNMG